MQSEFGDDRLREEKRNVQRGVSVQYFVVPGRYHAGTQWRFVAPSEVYSRQLFPITQSAPNDEEVVIAKKGKDGWSIRATGDFDSEFLDDIFDDLGSEEIQLAFEAQDVVEELMIKAEVNAKAREIIWEDGQILSLRDSIERLAEECPQYPFDMLERQFLVWLEHFPPESYSQVQLDEYEALSERWLDDYAREFGLQR